MGKKISLKALLLVSSITLSGQENTWAMEEDTPHGYKRTPAEVQLTPQDQSPKRRRTEATPLLGPHDPMEIRVVETALVNLYSFEDLPSEVVLDEILGPMDVEKDRTVLFAFMKTCEKFKGIVVEKYSRVNKIQRHFPWEDQPDLYATTVYFTGTRLRGLLGLGENIAHEELVTKALEDDQTHFEAADKRRFSKGLDKFLNTKVFPEGTFINACIKHLRISEQSQTAAPQLPKENVLDDARKNLNHRFTHIVQGAIDSGSRNRFQNEFILYVYFIHFHTPNHERKSEYLKSLQTDPTYTHLTCSLKDMFNPQLLSLKATPGLDQSRFADIWNSIIDLDPGVSLYQLLQAATCLTGPGPGESLHARSAKAAEYYEMIFKALTQGEQEPTANDLCNAGLAYLSADNDAKAAEYFDEVIEVLEQSGQEPDELNYENAMDAHFRAGNYEKATYYSVLYLEALSRQQRPSFECFGKAADAHFRAGYYVQAADYRDKQLQAIHQSGRRPEPVDFKNAALAHHHAENYAKEAEYHDKYLEALTQSGQIPTPQDFGAAAFAHTRIGDYIKAAEHYDSKLKAIAQARQIPKAQDFCDTALAYSKTGNYPKAAECLETLLKLPNKSKQQVPAKLYRNIVDLFTRAGNFEKAAHYQSFLETPSEAMDLSE